VGKVESFENEKSRTEKRQMRPRGVGPKWLDGEIIDSNQPHSRHGGKEPGGLGRNGGVLRIKSGGAPELAPVRLEKHCIHARPKDLADKLGTHMGAPGAEVGRVDHNRVELKKIRGKVRNGLALGHKMPGRIKVRTGMSGHGPVGAGNRFWRIVGIEVKMALHLTFAGVNHHAGENIERNINGAAKAMMKGRHGGLWEKRTPGAKGRRGVGGRF